jgi:hypothetical protein
MHVLLIIQSNTSGQWIFTQIIGRDIGSAWIGDDALLGLGWHGSRRRRRGHRLWRLRKLFPIVRIAISDAAPLHAAFQHSGKHLNIPKYTIKTLEKARFFGILLPNNLAYRRTATTECVPGNS